MYVCYFTYCWTMSPSPPIPVLPPCLLSANIHPSSGLLYKATANPDHLILGKCTLQILIKMQLMVKFKHTDILFQRQRNRKYASN